MHIIAASSSSSSSVYFCTNEEKQKSQLLKLDHIDYIKTLNLTAPLSFSDLFKCV